MPGPPGSSVTPTARHWIDPILAADGAGLVRGAAAAAAAHLFRANASAPRLVTDSGTSVVSATIFALPGSTPLPIR